MRKLILNLVLILLFVISSSVYGGDKNVSATYYAKTGDSAFDATLGELNVQTYGRDMSDFISNMSLSYNIPKIRIEDLLFKVEMTPADVYMTLGIGKIANKSIDEVVGEYKANKGQGWGVIAKRLGIKPGSKEFHALKKGGSVELEKAKGKGKDKDKGDEKEKGKKKSKKSKKQKKK